MPQQGPRISFWWGGLWLIIKKLMMHAKNSGCGSFAFENSNQILRSGLLPCLFLVLQNQWILAGCVILQPCTSIWRQCACICWSCQWREGQEQYGMLSGSDNVCLCCLFCSCLNSTPLIIVLQEWWFDWGFANFLGFSFFHVVMVSMFFWFSLVRFSIF